MANYDIRKLPQWVQSRLADQKRRIENRERKIAELQDQICEMSKPASRMWQCKTLAIYLPDVVEVFVKDPEKNSCEIVYRNGVVRSYTNCAGLFDSWVRYQKAAQP